MNENQEGYTKEYIVQALFKLMASYEYEKINVTDVCNKAGVGRATFYRHFKSKEDVINYSFDQKTKQFISNQHFFPRCREDYIDTVKKVFKMFKENIEPFRLIRRAHLDYIYLDYLNRVYKESFERDYQNKNSLAPYLYAGMLYNVSIAWLDTNCEEPIDSLAEFYVNSIFA